MYHGTSWDDTLVTYSQYIQLDAKKRILQNQPRNSPVFLFSNSPPKRWQMKQTEQVYTKVHELQ